MNLTRKIKPIRLYFLSTFRLERDSETIRFSTRKVESLFAYLALFPEPHPREKLAALLWGDSTDEQARHSLRTALAAIRKELGDEILLADRETVQLNPDFPIWVDAREFQSALDLYRGDLLLDFYDDWILPEREHLRKIYLDALLQLVQHHRAKSEYARAVEFARQVLASDPANEKAYQHIIFCLAATGDRIGALKQYDECAKKLRDELGVEPSKETLALRDQIEQALTGSQAREALFTNVPVPLTSFVGREKELAEQRELLGHTRLLTLTGAGGCGKTRLAIQLATELANANRFKHGAWWVELAPLADPALVSQTVASVFDLEETPNTPILTTLTNYLRAKELLLVLDNCEHLIDACAQLADALLRACPQLKILASSREALGIAGETAYRVPSLEIPNPKLQISIEQLSKYDAVRLFIDRALAAKTDFAVTNANAPAVVQICHRLDGIPLALELAAARVKSLSVEQIAARLDDRFRLLTGGSRTALPRQQTLRALIDWSYSLLAEEERVLLRRLSVFVGGWTLEAAQSVCSCDPVCADDVLDLLARLADKSLVIVEQSGSEARYRLMETIRQYARDRLLESGEAETLRDQHLDFFVALAEEVEPKLRGAEQFQWLDRLEVEHDNLRAALEWSQGQGRVQRGLRLAGALRLFWLIQVYYREGQETVEQLLRQPEAAGKTLARAHALYTAAKCTEQQGNFKLALGYFEEAITIARELGQVGKKILTLALADWEFRGLQEATVALPRFEEAWTLGQELDDPRIIASLLHVRGKLLLAQRDYKAARTSFEEGIAQFRKIGDTRMATVSLGELAMLTYREGDYVAARSQLEQILPFLRQVNSRRPLLVTLIRLGEIARSDGDYSLARQYYEQALAIAQDIGNQSSICIGLGNLGETVLRLGEISQARKLLIDALMSARQINQDWIVVFALGGLAFVAVVQNQAARAARLLAAVDSLAKLTGILSSDPSPADNAELEHYLGIVRAQLDEATFNAAWADGQKMTLEQAVEYALENVK